MLKFLFWILLIGNGMLFSYQRGYLAPFFTQQNESGRSARQFNIDKIKVLTPESVTASVQASASAAPASPPPSPEPAPLATPTTAPSNKPNDVVACVEMGNFTEIDAKRFKKLLANLALGDRLSQRPIEEVVNYMVYIPPQGSKESADRKSAELRRLGVNDFYIVQDNTDMRWSISLGVFKTQEAAQHLLAELIKQGVKSARIGVRNVAVKKSLFQAREINAKTKERITQILGEFVKIEMRECS